MKLDSTALIGAAAVLGMGMIVLSSELNGGQNAPPAPPPAAAQGAALPPGHPPLDGPASGGTQAAGPLVQAEVQQAIRASRYVFLEVEVEGEPLWIATGAVEVSEGDRVTFGEGMVMLDFYSETLDRTFDEILFIGGLQVTGGS